MVTAQEIESRMVSLRDDAQREILMRFFKTQPGQYGHGDDFLGIKVPQTRQVAKEAKDLPLEEIRKLLFSPWHEVRLCALLFLVAKFERLACPARMIYDESAINQRDQLVDFYLHHADRANNWDLVDLSVYKIVGHWLLLPTRLGGAEHQADNTPLPSLQAVTMPSDDLLHRQYKLSIIDGLAHSSNLWLQRMSMVCTWKTIRQGDPSWCLRYAEIHLHHSHDLMHKAVGWMLREMGKHVSMDLLRDFLRQHVREMSRTTLRYAIEKMSEEERHWWMDLP